MLCKEGARRNAASRHEPSAETSGGSPENQVQSAAVISSLCRGWLSPPPSHSCSHPLRSPLPRILGFLCPLFSLLPFFWRTLELDRCGTKKSPLPHCRFHLTSRAVESAWRRSHDRGPRAFRAPVSCSLDRSTISLDNTFYIRQVVCGLKLLRLWKHYLLQLTLVLWITHKLTHGLNRAPDLGITLRNHLELVTCET